MVASRDESSSDQRIGYELGSRDVVFSQTDNEAERPNNAVKCANGTPVPPKSDGTVHTRGRQGVKDRNVFVK